MKSIAWLVTMALAVACTHETTPEPPPAAPTPTAQPIATAEPPPPAQTVQQPAPVLPATAQWIVCERIANDTRWLLVAGTVPHGAESDPPVDADYVVLKKVDEAFARKANLPVRTLDVPRRYVLPEAFTVKLHVDTEPPGARVYEVRDGALVSLGAAPVDVVYRGTASDLHVKLLGSTWLVPDVERRGASVGLWAANDAMTSAPGTVPSAVPLVTSADLEALRHGQKRIDKSFTLSVHTPIAQESRISVRNAVIVNVPFLTLP